MAVNKSVYYKRLNKWADALVSKKYKQIKNQLRDEDNGRCCLGVACDVSGLSEWTANGAYLGSLGHAPCAVQNYFGFTDGTGESVLEEVSSRLHTNWGGLTDMNDSGNYSFGKIAKIIRKFAEIKYGGSKKSLSGPNRKKPKKSKA